MNTLDENIDVRFVGGPLDGQVRPAPLWTRSWQIGDANGLVHTYRCRTERIRGDGRLIGRTLTWAGAGCGPCS